MARIEDFGEKIHGAKKDLYIKQYSESFKRSIDDYSLEFSQLWPDLDYSKALKEADPADQESTAILLSWVRALRDSVDRKPTRAGELRRWAYMLEVYHSIAKDIIDNANELTNEKAWHLLIQNITESKGAPEGSFDRSNHFTQLIKTRAYLYQMVGHAKSLKNLKLQLYLNREKSSNNNQVFEHVIRLKAGSDTYSFNSDKSWIDCANEFANFYKENNLTDKRKSQKKSSASKIAVVHLTKNGVKKYFAAAKVYNSWVILEQYNNKQEAFEAVKDQAVIKELSERIAAWRNLPDMRNKENRERIGFDWREGRNISPEEFMSAFKFRGVQFGNYVEQTKRQDELNNSYDALMDLAYTLNITPEALALNRTLALAFGARGKGGINPANAHFEPGECVINLTKNNGAGSLAHEWFHAFDNFCAKQLNLSCKFLSEDKSFISSKPMFAQLIKSNFSKVYGRAASLDRRRAKGKAYWSTKPEMAARNFESAVIEHLSQKDYLNDYLANIAPSISWAALPCLIDPNMDPITNQYPYPLEHEVQENMEEMLAIFSYMKELTPYMQEPFPFSIEKPSTKQSELF